MSMKRASKAKIEAVHRAQAYIEQHLHEPITLQQVARAARYSPWYTARIFKEVTNKTPFEYIRYARLSEAASRLAAGQARIIDVAFDFLFDSHEGFTKAFARQFGMSPREFRRRRPRAKLFYPPRARELALSRTKGEMYMEPQSQTPNTVFVQILQRPQRKLILKRAAKATHYFEYCEEVGCEVWDVLSEIKDSIHEPMGLWLPESLRPPETSEYVQGVEVPSDFAGSAPEGFEVVELPPCQMMVFQGQPYEDEDFEEAIGQVQQAIAGYDPTASGYRWADDSAPRFQLVPLGYRGYIEARPVHALNA